jgi:hypothetical protein
MFTVQLVNGSSFLTTKHVDELGRAGVKTNDLDEAWSGPCSRLLATSCREPSLASAPPTSHCEPSLAFAHVSTSYGETSSARVYKDARGVIVAAGA